MVVACGRVNRLLYEAHPLIAVARITNICAPLFYSAESVLAQ